MSVHVISPVRPPWGPSRRGALDAPGKYRLLAPAEKSYPNIFGCTMVCKYTPLDVFCTYMYGRKFLQSSTRSSQRFILAHKTGSGLSIRDEIGSSQHRERAYALEVVAMAYSRHSRPHQFGSPLPVLYIARTDCCRSGLLGCGCGSGTKRRFVGETYRPRSPSLARVAAPNARAQPGAEANEPRDCLRPRSEVEDRRIPALLRAVRGGQAEIPPLTRSESGNT